MTEVEARGAGVEAYWDVVVVGAGPAGSMTAYELSRLGKSVLLLDRGIFSHWKVYGVTVSPGVMDLLAGVGDGNLLQRNGATPLHTLRLGGWSMKADLPLNGSMALSRVSLDSSLIDAAVRRGAHFLQGTKARLGALSKD